MRRGDKPQLRFALRATIWVIALLPLWWFVLRPPLEDWVRVSSSAVLAAIPGVHGPTGITAEPGTAWVLQLPAPGTRYRSARIVAEARVATVCTLNLPLFWALLFAGPWSWRVWRSFLLGSGISLAIEPFGLLAYGAHVLVANVYPHAPAAVVMLVSFADYLGYSVQPYIFPVLLVLALQPELRSMVLWDEAPSPPPPKPTPQVRHRTRT